MNYYITSIGYNVLYEPLEETLCEYNGKIGWAQPHFQRAWKELFFHSELAALNAIRNMYKNNDSVFTILEDTGKIITSHGAISGITSMKIRKVQNDF